MKTYQQQTTRGRQRLLTAGLYLIGLMACTAIGISTAQAQNYHVKDMGVLEGMKACEPAAMNNLGHITGTATAGDQKAAFLYYYNGNEAEMEELGGVNSRGFGINPGGIVVGDAVMAKDISHAAIFNGDGVVDLGGLEGQLYSRANSMNAIRQVVGYSGLKRDSSESRAFIWTRETGMIDIGTLGGAYAQAYAINDSGWVTGTSQIPDMGIRPQQSHAFVYQPLSPTMMHTDEMRDLGTLGGRFSYGMSINASKHVAGYSTIDGFDNSTHAFFYDGQTMLDLGSLEKEGFDHSAALAVNNSDQVVGVTYVPTGARGHFNQVAFVWNRSEKNGQMVNLNNLIAGWSEKFFLLSATAVNDHGQIAASAYDYDNGVVRAVLLTPTK